MEHDETQQEVNLEEMTDQELESLITEAEAEGGGESSQETDVSKEIEALKNRNAMLTRLLNKQNKAPQTKITSDNNSDIQKDIAELKFSNKVTTFADENGLTKKAAEHVLKLYPNATTETLQDPFVKAGIEALVRKERVVENTPRGGNSKSQAPTKKLSEMTPEEKQAWYTNRVSPNK